MGSRVYRSTAGIGYSVVVTDDKIAKSRRRLYPSPADPP